jgi:hypothetical protein
VDRRTSIPPPAAANAAQPEFQSSAPRAGDEIYSRDGRTCYVIQPDGSWKKTAEGPSPEDAVLARQAHLRDHARVSAAKLEKRSGLITPEAAAPPQLILGEDAEREFKKLTAQRR